MMRIALLGFAHETNTFSPQSAQMAQFDAYGTVRGDLMLERHATAHSTVAGFLAAAEDPDVEVVPLMWAWANPCGAITAETFEALSGELLKLLKENGPWDAVLLAQHGAAVAEGFPDADGEFVGRVRALVGDGLPIGVALDMHANVSQALVNASTVVVGLLTNPHVDARTRALECASLIIETVRGSLRPVMAFRQLDAVINILRQSTLDSPMCELVSEAASHLSHSEIVSVSLFEGYPYADVEAMGISCLVISNDDRGIAESHCQELAEAIWERRSDFDGNAYTPEEAVRMHSDAGPVVLLDVGDNIGAGGDGRSTVLLEAIMAARASGTVTILHDPEAAAMCQYVGLNAHVDVAVGRASGNGPRTWASGTVLALSDGRYEEPTPTHGGFRFFDSGLTAVIELALDNLVIVTSNLVLPTSLEQLRSLGIAPEQRRLIVAKGVVSPRAGYEPIAGEFALVNTPGVTSCELSSFEYLRRRRPLFPFEAVS
jgi:microcystin degradation protein MlrC